jgi:ABC-type lipoprotein export system ATPase subunit
MVTHDPRAARRAKRLLKLTNGTIVSEKLTVVSDKPTEEDDDDEACDAA